MFSIDNFIKNNNSSVEVLVKNNELNPETKKVKEIFDQIEKDCLSNEQLKKYFEELRGNCYRYTEIVCEFNQVFQNYQSERMSTEEYQQQFSDIDQIRSRVHDATIDSFNILSRLLLKNGKENDWVKPLVIGGRVAYGNYAIKKTVSDIIEFNKKSKGKKDE